MKTRVAVVLLLLLAILSCAYAEPRYVVTDLGSVDSRGWGVPGRAINNHRQVVCMRDHSMPVYLWDSGLYTKLDIKGTRVSMGARCVGINDACQITGATFEDHPCIWQNGTIIDLGGCLPPRSATADINNSGQIVGWYGREAVLWEQGEMTEVIPPEWLAWSSYAYAISENGIIAGQVGGATFIIDGGVAVSLDEVDGRFSEPSDVNNDGVVVGQADYGSPFYPARTAFMARSGELVPLEPLVSDRDSKANAINNAGLIVGSSFINDRTIPVPPKRAVIWENGVVRDLNDLVAPGSGLVLLEAWDINDRGDIVGEAAVPGVGPRGFLLTPWLLCVTIDVCPRVQPNEININGNQPVPVAVLSSDEFDANHIDYRSVRFAGAPAYRRQITDLDRDGRRDAIFWFRAGAANLCSNDTTAKLSGRTLQGRPFEGVDGVVVRGGAERPTPARPRYSFKELEPLPGTEWSEAYGINNFGQVVGGCNGIPCLWDGESVISLQYPGSRYSRACDINDSGQVVLNCFSDMFIWSDGLFTPMKMPGDTPWTPYAVNNRGDVVGWGFRTSGDTPARYACVWSDGQTTFLMPPYGDASHGVDINDSGLVAGQSSIPVNAARPWRTHPCTWLNGTVSELQLPDSFDEGSAIAVNNLGDVAGCCSSTGANYTERACLWHDGEPKLLKPLSPGSVEHVVSMNDWGQILGASRCYVPLSGFTFVCVLWHAGEPYDLNAVVEGKPEDLPIYEALDINDNGQMVGSTWGPDRLTKGFILTPIPLEVTIDIRPGDPRNMINTRSRGLVPVMVYSGEEFTTASLLPETVTLAGAGAQRWQTMPDTNGDGLKEMLFMFRSDQINSIDSDSRATLKGRTFDGWWIEGRDNVRLLRGNGR